MTPNFVVVVNALMSMCRHAESVQFVEELELSRYYLQWFINGCENFSVVGI